MMEISRIYNEVSPVETLFVADSMTGQDAVNSARAFDQALELTGVVLTKLMAMRVAVRPYPFVKSQASPSNSWVREKMSRHWRPFILIEWLLEFWEWAMY